MKNYRICANCIMDTTDPHIHFDERGWCNHCRNYHDSILPSWHPNEAEIRLIEPLIEKIKREGNGRDHDCLIGISGGLDSSYVIACDGSGSVMGCAFFGAYGRNCFTPSQEQPEFSYLPDPCTLAFFAGDL